MNCVMASNTSISVGSVLPPEVAAALIGLLVTSPPLLIAVTLAYFSGHLWTYIILSYVSKKERKILCSRLGRIGVGLIWFALLSIPVSAILYSNLLFSTERLASISITTAISSLALQAIILIAINFFARERKKK